MYIKIKKEDIVFVAIFIASLILYFSFIFAKEIFQYGDNCGYMLLAKGFYLNHNFVNISNSSHTSLLWWPPGFPLFLSFLYIFFGENWILMKIVIVLLYFLSVFYFVKNYKFLFADKISGIIFYATLLLSAPVHLLSSYLYSETFFTSMILFIAVLFRKISNVLSFKTIIGFSFLLQILFTIRLVGMVFPIAFTIYLLVNMSGLKKFMALIPFTMFLIVLLLFLFYPPLMVGSARSAFGISTTIVNDGIDENKFNFFSYVLGYVVRFFKSFSGYFFTLIPQSLFRYSYQVVQMNPIKKVIMGMISLITIYGIIKIIRKELFFGIFTLLYLSLLLVYGPLYLRLLVPISPFLLLAFYTGLSTLIKKNKWIRYEFFYVIILIIFLDNVYLTFTNPRKTMPADFGGVANREEINWVINTLPKGSRVVSQFGMYIYLNRNDLATFPYDNCDTDSTLLNYIKKRNINYIVATTLNHKKNRFLTNSIVSVCKKYPESFKIVYNSKNDTLCKVIKVVNYDFKDMK